MIKIFSLFVLCLLCIGSNAATIAELASSTPTLRELHSLLATTDLEERLRGEGPFTAFAPTNRAFSRVDRETLNEVTSDTQMLTDLLAYHVVDGKLRSGDLEDELILETLQGNKLRINKYENKNGPATVTVNGKRVSTADVPADNGVVHILDDVIFPMVQDSDTLVSILTNDKESRFSALLNIVTSANLAEKLAETGPFTLFAPTNEAFDKLAAGTLDNLSPEEVADIVKLHLAPGTKFALGFSPSKGIQTLLDESTLHVGHGRHSLVVSSDKSKAHIEQPDIVAANGVVHVIDNVLLP